MKNILAILAAFGAFLGAASAGPAAGRIIVLDNAKPDNVWSTTVTRGESIYIRADIYNRGAVYTNNDLRGYIWYASNNVADAGVRISSTTQESGSVWFLLSATDTLGLATNDTFPTSYFAQVVLTNATVKYDWAQGRVVVRNGSGISATGSATITTLNNGGSLTNLNASELRTGTVPLARLSGVTTNNASQLDSGTVADALIASTIARDSEVDAHTQNVTTAHNVDARIAASTQTIAGASVSGTVPAATWAAVSASATNATSAGYATTAGSAGSADSANYAGYLVGDLGYAFGNVTPSGFYSDDGMGGAQTWYLYGPLRILSGNWSNTGTFVVNGAQTNHSSLTVLGGGNVVTNGGGEYTITVPLGTASNSPVNRKQLYDLLDERSIVTLYGSTSVHATLAGAYGLESTSPTTAWAVTNATLADGTNWVGYFFTTNTTTILRAGTYIGRFYAQKTAGTKTANAIIQLVYSDTATTNIVATSAVSGAIASFLDSYRVHASANTNVMGTALYVGVRYGLVVSGVGSDPTVVTYGGGDYNTHLETPGFGPVSGYVLDGAAGVSFSGTTTVSNLVVNGAQTNMGTITCPTIIGGTSTNSILTLQATSGVGTGSLTAVQIAVGTNGSLKALTAYNNGDVAIGGGLALSGATMSYSGGINLKSGRVIDANGGQLYLGSGTGATTPTLNAGGVGAVLFSVGVEKMRLNSSGFGIGTNAPAATLDVNGSAIVRTNLTVNQVIYFQTNTVVTAPAAGFGGMYIDAQTNYWFWHPNAGGTGAGWTNKLW
jgi:hypothetical protein